MGNVDSTAEMLEAKIGGQGSASCSRNSQNGPLAIVAVISQRHLFSGLRHLQLLLQSSLVRPDFLTTARQQSSLIDDQKRTVISLPLPR